jgi:hypothetical protein
MLKPITYSDAKLRPIPPRGRTIGQRQRTGTARFQKRDACGCK